jgi:hypothetical protein
MKTSKPAKWIPLVAMGMVLAACGSKSEDVASLAATPVPVVESETLDDEAKMMAFAQCMRDEGIELLDPGVDADGNVQKPELAEGFEASKEKWTAADAVCGELLEGITFGKERVDMSEVVDQYVALATCLRERGFEVDDPTAETLDIWLTDFKTVFNWEDPDNLEAYQSCAATSLGGNGSKGK